VKIYYVNVLFVTEVLECLYFVMCVHHKEYIFLNKLKQFQKSKRKQFNCIAFI
jgi:hypothetical protein